MTLFLGIDFGTTGFKVHLFSERGESIAWRGGNIPVEYPQPGMVEQDAGSAWEAIRYAIQAVLADTGKDCGPIGAVVATGTSHLTLWDEDGNCLRPAILYGDLRLPGEPAMQRILNEIGAGRIASTFGLEKATDVQIQIIMGFMAASKLIWLWENERDVFTRTHSWVANGWDFINYKLTGRTAFLGSEYAVDREITSLFGLAEAGWGKPVQAGDVVGQVSASAARQTGLAEGTPVVVGTRDSLVGFLGAGITRPGMALNQCGTTDVVAVSYRNQQNSTAGYPVESLVPGLKLISLSPLRGPMLKWVHDLLLPPDAPYAMLDELAAQAPPGSEGLICLPYLTGEKAVVHDLLARAVFVGLDRRHGRAHLARAVLEGIVFGMADILAAYQADGYPLEEIRVGGGGARSDLWNQIKADVLEKPVAVLKVLETGCLGAAMIAATAMGIYPDLATASQAMAHISHVVEPQLVNAAAYRRTWQAYQMIYPGCRKIFPLLEEIRTSQRSEQP